MATIEDVAREADVSKSTVSHVINGTRYVSPELTEKVQAAMKELNYHSPNAIARSLKTQKTFTIGLVCSDITNLFSPFVARGLERIASERGYNVIVSNTDEVLKKEQRHIDSLIEQRVDGVVIVPTGKDDAKVNLLRQQGIPFVFLDRKIDSVEAAFVTSANKLGAYTGTEFLIKQGHRRIGIILGPGHITTTKRRFAGYKEALDNHGLDLSFDLVVEQDYKLRGGELAAEKLLGRSQKPTAIFATNVMFSLGALKAIHCLGLHCPDDVSLVGYDDVPWAETLNPPLTVITQKPYEMGYQAGKLLIERLDGDGDVDTKTIKLSTELRVRESVKVINPGN